MKPTFFSDAAAFRLWLMHNHATVREFWVGFHKRSSGKPSMTWPEAVDQLLCFGWIDGVRKSLDDQRYVIRVTPRKPGSIWSAVNVKRAKELVKSGLMHEVGLKAFSARDVKKTNRYSFERARVRLDRSLQKQFRAKAEAWEFFQRQPPGYRKIILWWVMNAKQATTRERRLGIVLRASDAGRRVNLLQPGKEADTFKQGVSRKRHKSTR
jgi:uncharacterized protein YdeI (YjbR/CyaY-like superfamily)